MMKKEKNNQLLFDALLQEVDGTSATLEQANITTNTKNQSYSNQIANAPTEMEKLTSLEKRRQKVKERYTKYCIEWTLGLHIKTRLMSNFIPHVDKILPFYQITLQGKQHNFLSALVDFQDYQGAFLFLNYPPVRDALFSQKRQEILNWDVTRPLLKHAITQNNALKNSAFKDFFHTLKAVYGTPKLYEMILFDTDEMSPLDITKTALFPPHQLGKNTSAQPKVLQSALSYLITHGALMEALDYLSQLPKGTSIGDICALVSDPLAGQELKRLGNRKAFKNQNEIIFTKTMEENLSAPAFLFLMHQYQGDTAYNDATLFNESEKHNPLIFKVKDKNRCR